MKRSAVCLLLATAGFLLWNTSRRDLPATDSRASVSKHAASVEASELATSPQRVIEDHVPPAPQEPGKTEPLLVQRQDIRWQQPVAEPALADFKSWADDYAAAPSEVNAEEGVRLARERRAALLDLIDRDPRRALELAVPESVRRTLPSGVLAELEERISGRGDLLVAAATAIPTEHRALSTEHPPFPAVMRTVTMNGREFETYTYGRRESAMSREQIAVHGIALDGKLAMSEWPARVLEPIEAKEARAKLSAPPLCPVSGAVLDGNGDEVVLDWSLEQAQWFCQAGHAMQELEAAAAKEAALPPGVAAAGIGGGGADLPVAQSGYTEGTKKMLIIRVDFPDKTGQVVSDATLTSLINNFSSHWPVMSYGKLHWARAGEGSDFTPTLRLPGGHASYTGFSTMLNAARSAAEDAGFDYRDYHFEVVVTGDKPDVSFGGIAYVGGRGSWLANASWNLGVGSHEVGHNFGLNHSGFWDTTDGTPNGAGENVEYGNPFDHMGGASSSTQAHFSARQKNYLDWIPDADVKKVTTNGTFSYRIAAFDKQAATGARSIAVDRSGTGQDYWIEYRTAYGSNIWMNDGVVINFGDVTLNNGRPSLLDFTPNTGSKDDCALLIGKTFSEPAAKIHITPTGRGTDANSVPYMDVTVNRGDFPGNLKPAVALEYSPANPAVNANAIFTATASDPNGDTVSYFWDWGDSTFTANNNTAATHKWDSAGVKTVRCIVSDMKGLTATASVLVQVGTSSTFFISGYVRRAGLPVEGVTVSGGGRSDATDSEGFYAITGLAAGSHTVSAVKTGFTLAPDGFTNPVSVGPSRSGMDFIAPQGSPVFGTMKPALVDAGSNTGAVPLPLADNDTLVTAITLSTVSSDTAVVANNQIAFGSAEPRTVTVSASAGKSGTVNITITATDPEGGTASYVWPVTVNAPPVHALTPQSATENTPLDIDLRTLVSDDRTPDDRISFRMDRVRNGSVTLLPDGHTARFTPAAGFNGAASFRLTSRDQSLSSRTLLLYDFEPDANGAGISSGKTADLSNFNRPGTLQIIGSGEYTAVADVPPPLAPHSTMALNLSENGAASAAKLKHSFAATDLNWNDADWTFCVWVKRTTTDTDDFVFHLGDGDGRNAFDQLGLYFAANSNELRLDKHTATASQAVLTATVAPGEWHYLSITYDRTATNAGMLSLYVDGFLAGSAAGLGMGVNQTRSMVIGGHADGVDVSGYLDGRVDDAMMAGSVLGRAELRALATMGTAHFLGLSDVDTVSITVTGTNGAPQISDAANVGLNTGTPSAPVPFAVNDVESEARSLTVTAQSSLTSLIPVSGIAISTAPPAWSSADIGAAGAAGSSTEDHGTFLISGSGTDIGGAADEFRFVNQDSTGDGEIVCRVQSLDYTHQDAKAGLMLRDGTAAGAPFAMISATAGSGVTFLHRATADAAAMTDATVNFLTAPVWLRLVRTGSSFAGFYAGDANGVPGAWQAVGSAATITMGPTVKAGMAVTSRADNALTMAVMDHVSGNVRLGGERTVTLTPAAGLTGTATITLTVSDGAATATDTFLAVVGINTPPVISTVADMSAVSGDTPAPFSITIGDLHTPLANLTVTASSSDSLLLPNNRVTFTGSGAQRTVQLRPVPGESGTATVTLRVSDGSVTTTTTFTLTVTPGDPSLLVHAGTNWRYLDTGANPVNWQMSGFNDSTWPIGPAQLGFGEGDESTPLNNNAARKTTYFRRDFRVPDPSLYNYLSLRVLRDDGAVVYLNGLEIWRTNIPGGIVNSATDAIVAVIGGDENKFFDFIVRRPPLVTGTNIIAVELHQKGTTSSDLSFDLEARGTNPAPLEAIAPGAVWSYLDSGADPGNGWMDILFADSTWKAGPAQLGYGDGDETTVIAGGPDTARYVTSWFRKQFNVPDKGDVAGIGLRVLRDDGIQVWLNGQVLYRDNLPASPGATTLASSAIGASAEDAWQTIYLPTDLLLTGTNQLAAEIHQASLISSDVSFDLQLLLFTHDSLPPLTVTPAGANLTLTWPLWAEGWIVQSSATMATWTYETAAPVAGPLSWSLALPRTTARRYIRLAQP